MAELNIIPGGALLIRDGLIVDLGPTRRVENLAAAKRARELDASGKVVMPAFSDPDAVLFLDANGAAMDRLPLKRMQSVVAAAAKQWARYGCLSVGTHTGLAAELKSAAKKLRVFQQLQLKPLRIRAIFAATRSGGLERESEGGEWVRQVVEEWLPAVRERKLASVVELSLRGDETPAGLASVREVAVAASGLGFTFRLRSTARPAAAALQMALSAGAIALLAPPEDPVEFIAPLAAMGCVRVIPANESAADDIRKGTMRAAIGADMALALTPAFRADGPSSLNMQYLLHVAVHRLGLSPEEAIMATTYNAACSLRMSHVTGSLEPGKSADFLVMDVPDYRDLPRRVGHHDMSLAFRAGRVACRNGFASD